jgi:hypothetical protein
MTSRFIVLRCTGLLLAICVTACGGNTTSELPGIHDGHDTSTCVGNGCSSESSEPSEPEPSDPPPASTPPPAGSAVLVSGGLACTTTRSNAGRSIAVSGQASVHVALRCGATSGLFVASSTNGGSTYDAAVSVGIVEVEEVAIATGPAGTVFIAATVMDPLPRVLFASSSDNGASWSTPVELGTQTNSEPLFGHEVSVVVRGTDVLVQFDAASTSDVVVVRVPSLGAGTPASVTLEMPSSLSELVVDSASQSVVVASDALSDANYYLNVSSDGGQTFALTRRSGRTPALLGDWAAGHGRIFFAGSGFVGLGIGPGDSRLLSIYAPASQPWHRELISGLPDSDYVTSFDELFHRAITVDAFGHAYVVTRRIDGAIQLDRLVSGATTFEPPVTIAAAGRSPAIAPLPTSDGAAIAFVTGSAGEEEVYAFVYRYAPLSPCVAGGSGSCLDVDECAVANGGCSADALCTSRLYDRTCTCRPGFVGDGVTCEPSWSEIARVDLPNADREGFGMRATAVGDRIYVRPEANDQANLYFHYIDTGDATPMLSPPLTLPPDAPGDFCACGLTETFVGDDTGIAMLGNDGVRYDAATDSWTQVSAYAPLRRGEAAAAFDDVAGVFRVAGGRGPLDTSLVYNPSTDSVDLEAPLLPFTVGSAAAWSPTGTGVLYVAGGEAGDGSERHLMASTVGGVWMSHPDAPEDIGRRAVGMGDFAGLLWIAVNNHFRFYDPSDGTWRSTVIDAPAGMLAAVTATTGTYVLAQDGSEVVLYRLNAIE